MKTGWLLGCLLQLPAEPCASVVIRYYPKWNTYEVASVTKHRKPFLCSEALIRQGMRVEQVKLVAARWHINLISRPIGDRILPADQLDIQTEC